MLLNSESLAVDDSFGLVRNTPDPNDRPHARPFDSELQLVDAMQRYVRRSQPRKWNVVLELDAGVGLADLVLATRAPNSTRALRLLADLPPRLAPLLDAEVSHRVASREDLANLLGLSTSAASRILGTLRRSGVIREMSGQCSVASVAVPPFRTVIAVEAKLTDWQRALMQAYRNQQFADESWVVLDHCYHRAALRNVERFSQSGVGLASMDRHSKLFVHLPAKNDSPTSRAKSWFAQAALSRRIASFRSVGLLKRA